MKLSYDIRCTECSFYIGFTTCDECGDIVCGNSTCVKSFHHNTNRIWIICNSCNSYIWQKLKPVYYKTEKDEEIMTIDDVDAVIGLLVLNRVTK